MTQRSIKSAERTLRLFELFSRRQQQLTVSEVARGLAIPQPSASMLLTNLAAMGYLGYDRMARSYAPTIRVALLGGWIGPRFKGPWSLASRLDELHDHVGEDVYVGIQNGPAAQIVQVRGGEDDLSIDSGQMYSLTRSAIGQALLSATPDAELVRLVRRCNAEAEDGQQVNEAAFLALIEDVRRNGYAVTSGYYLPDRSGIAVAVSPPSGLASFAVGFGGQTPIIEAKRDLILQELRGFQAAALEFDDTAARGLADSGLVDDRKWA